MSASPTLSGESQPRFAGRCVGSALPVSELSLLYVLALQLTPGENMTLYGSKQVLCGGTRAEVELNIQGVYLEVKQIGASHHRYALHWHELPAKWLCPSQTLPGLVLTVWSVIMPSTGVNDTSAALGAEQSAPGGSITAKPLEHSKMDGGFLAMAWTRISASCARRRRRSHPK